MISWAFGQYIECGFQSFLDRLTSQFTNISTISTMISNDESIIYKHFRICAKVLKEYIKRIVNPVISL